MQERSIEKTRGGGVKSNHSLFEEIISLENLLLAWQEFKIIKSYSTQADLGLLLGNITSQLFANIYLNGLDQFVKHQLRIKFYVRYCDDFVILSGRKSELENFILVIGNFLTEKLHLLLHPSKIEIRKYHQGIDFLGYVSFPRHRLLRNRTKKRMFKKIGQRFSEFEQSKITNEIFNQVLQSYLGLLKHCNGHKIVKELEAFLSSPQDCVCQGGRIRVF